MLASIRKSTRLRAATAVFMLAAMAAAALPGPAGSNGVDPERRALCVETVTELTKGHPSSAALALCAQGALGAAIESAMAPNENTSK